MFDFPTQNSSVKVAWLDTFQPHFNAVNGSYVLWKESIKNHSTSSFFSCAPLTGKMSYDISTYDASRLVQHEFPNIPVIVTYDILYDRFDVHQGPLTHYDPYRLDCVHLCLQPCFWDAILFRMGKVVADLIQNYTSSNLDSKIDKPYHNPIISPTKSKRKKSGGGNSKRY